MSTVSMHSGFEVPENIKSLAMIRSRAVVGVKALSVGTLRTVYQAFQR